VLSLLAAAYSDVGRFDQTDSLAQVGEQLARRHNFLRGIGLNRLRRAYVRINQSDLEAARQLCWQALQVLNQLDPPMDAALAHTYLGGIYNIEGRLDSARWHFGQAQRHGNVRMQAVAALNLGVIEANAGQLPQAIKRYLQALQSAQSLGDHKLESTLLMNIGNVYTQMGEPSQAVDWYNRAIALLERYRFHAPVLALAYYNVASATRDLGQPQRQLELLERALALADSIGDRDVQALACAALGQLAIDAGDWELAQRRLTKAQAAAIESDDVVNQARVANAWARYHLAQRAWGAARRWARQVVQLLAHAPKASELELAYQALYQADSAEGRLADALQHFRLKTAWRDSLREQSKALEIGRLEASFQAERELERERARMQAQIDEREAWLLGAGAGLVGLIALVVLLNYLRRLQRKRNRLLRRLTNRIYLQKAEIEAQNSEITAQHNQLAKANLKLQELDRLKEELTGMVVHDLKNPLNAILTLTALPPEPNRLLMMRAAGLQMSHLVSNLLDIQKYENAALKLNLEPTRAVVLFNRAVEQTLLLAQARHQTFDLQIDKGLLVQVDAELLVRVLVNLLTNAIKYAPPGDTLVLEAYFDAHRGGIFRVTDHGPGMAPEHQEHIFEKYAQVAGGVASGRLRSTGLGLTFCRMVLEAHGGRIGVASEQGKFTTFEFNLPEASIESTDASGYAQLLRQHHGGTLPRLPAELQQRYAHVLAELSRTPLYEMSRIIDLLDSMPEQEVQNWQAAVEEAALAGLEDDYQQLLGTGL
jgi:signal transduction histidine kinase